MAALALLAGVSGCASGEARLAASPEASPEATVPAHSVVTVPMPDLGPYPTAPPLTPEEQEAARIANEDAAWQTVVAQYPDAVRPAVVFEGFVGRDEWLAVYPACLEGAGVAMDRGFATPELTGPPISIGAMPASQEQAIAAFDCAARFPMEQTWRPHTPEQVSWLYDYATQFLVPCFEANGVENPPPPTREEYLALWPAPGWVPSSNPSGLPLDQERLAAIDEACPFDGTTRAD